MNSVEVLKISKACLDSQYRGAGKAWAAVKNGEVVAVRYMDEVPLPGFGTTPLPGWVKAVNSNAEGRDHHWLPTAWSSKALSKMAGACEAAGDCPTKPRGGRYRPKELLTMARAALAAIRSAEFAAYRLKCRDELAELGEVVSGMCSCTEFVLKP